MDHLKGGKFSTRAPFYSESEAPEKEKKREREKEREIFQFRQETQTFPFSFYNILGLIREIVTMENPFLATV